MAYVANPPLGPQRLLYDLAKNWWLLLLRGICAILFGVLTFVWPGITLLTLVLLYGAYALADGVLALAEAVMGGAPAPRWWLALVGLLGIAVGILTFAWPGITALMLLLFIVGWAIATGVLQIVGAIRLRKEIDNEWLLIASGVLSVIFGLILVVQPATGALALLYVIGIYAILYGILEIWLSLRLREHATISDFLARKGVASTSAALAVSTPAKPDSPGAEDRRSTLADMAARVGEDNEELRNLLIETDRRICALDDLREVFRKLIEPMESALQALEQEKADNVSLRNALAELRAGHESVCSEFSALEKRAAELESAGEELRRELALAQEATRGLERDKTELTSEIVAVRAEVANLESQLAQETANGRALSEANQILVDHANSTDKRIVELQSEGALMREKLLLLENDKRSLQTALDQTLAETSRLSRRLTESENALTAARARLEQMDISLAAAENERVTLATARDEADERHQSEAYALNLRLEALRSRAATAEELLSEVRQTLGARTEEIRVLQRNAVEATIARNATEKVVERLTAARDALDGKVRELEQGRASLTEQSNGLAETLKARETSLAHAEQKIKSLTDRIAEIEVDARAYRAKTERRIDELNASLQRERAEFAIAQGALETTRRGYARLQRDMLAGRPAPQRSATLEEISDTAKEPSKSGNGKDDGRGPKTGEAEPEGGAAEPSSTR